MGRFSLLFLVSSVLSFGTVRVCPGYTYQLSEVQTNGESRFVGYLVSEHRQTTPGHASLFPLSYAIVPHTGFFGLSHGQIAKRLLVPGLHTRYVVRESNGDIEQTENMTTGEKTTFEFKRVDEDNNYIITISDEKGNRQPFDAKFKKGSVVVTLFNTLFRPGKHCYDVEIP